MRTGSVMFRRLLPAKGTETETLKKHDDVSCEINKRLNLPNDSDNSLRALWNCGLAEIQSLHYKWATINRRSLSFLVVLCSSSSTTRRFWPWQPSSSRSWKMDSTTSTTSSSPSSPSTWPSSAPRRTWVIGVGTSCCALGGWGSEIELILYLFW